MAKIDFNKIPKYAQLPIKPGAPAHSNWGVFGDDDEVGCFNFSRRKESSKRQN